MNLSCIFFLTATTEKNKKEVVIELAEFYSLRIYCNMRLYIYFLFFMFTTINFIFLNKWNSTWCAYRPFGKRKDKSYRELKNGRYQKIGMMTPNCPKEWFITCNIRPGWICKLIAHIVVVHCSKPRTCTSLHIASKQTYLCTSLLRQVLISFLI